ncbi:MAG: cbb3-type cytochrome c oxidase subunit I [candidate division FCPU426 bacterium]
MSVTCVADYIHPEPTTFFRKYVWSYDHKVIGKQYLWTSLVFLMLGGTLAMLLRWQIAYPSQPVPFIGELLKNSFFFGPNGEVTSDGYLQLGAMHGLIMVFFVIIPLIVGAFGNFLIPLHIGARDVAFPLLNALSYWLYLPAGLMMFSAFFVDKGAAAAGWTAYPPLSDAAGASVSGLGMNLVLGAIFLAGFSSIVGGMNFLVTIVKLRAPGMTWSRLPLVTWAQFITAVFQTLATPMIAAGGSMLLFDRLFNSSFFIPYGLHIGAEKVANAGGGFPLLFQHIFWFYAHPAVYILILPTMGLASDIIATFARKPIFGYRAMVISMTSIMGLGFIVWGHHMFLSGLNPKMGMAFMISTVFIALPSGVKVFNWLGTLWGGAIRLKGPMLYAISFVAMFIVGGLSGIFMAATPVDIFIHDTYYIIAHFHYVVFGATLFAVFGGLTFWFPKIFGRMMNESLNKLHWFLTFLFFNLAFFPMHFLGEAGHMRRLATSTGYEFLNGMAPWNEFITLSAFALGISQIVFLYNFVYSVFFGPTAPSNPWEGNTLEWTIPNPVPHHNFDKVPTVYRGPYEYSGPEATALGKDWISQDHPPVEGVASNQH